MTLPSTLCTQQSASSTKSLSLAPVTSNSRNFNVKTDSGNIYVNYSSSISNAEITITKYALTSSGATISASDYQLLNYKGQVNLVITADMRAWYQPPAVCESRFDILVTLPSDPDNEAALNLLTKNGDIYVAGSSNASVTELNAEAVFGNVYVSCDDCALPLSVAGSPHMRTLAGNITVHDVNVGGSLFSVYTETGFVNMSQMLFTTQHGAGGVLSIEGDTASVNISQVNRVSISVNVGKGDIDMFVQSDDVKGGYFNGRFDIKSGDGDVAISGNDFTTDSVTDKRKTGYIKGPQDADGNMFATLYTGDGDVSLKVNNPFAGASTLTQTLWLLMVFLAATMAFM